MGKRLSPHRRSRDEGRAEEIRQLKHENQKLKRQLAQVRKQVVRLLKQEQAAVIEVEPKPTAPPCPKCQGPLREIEVGSRMFAVCPACKYRKGK